MGKHFNAEIYRQLEHHMDKGLDEAMGDGTPPLTEAERDQIGSDDYWRRIDAEARGIGVGRWP